MKPQPLKWVRILLEWCAGKAKIEDLLVDLEELFYHVLNSRSPFVAVLAARIFTDLLDLPGQLCSNLQYLLYPYDHKYTIVNERTESFEQIYSS